MIERVVHPYNLQKAVEQVVSNKGSAGVDGIKTSQLKTLFPNGKTNCSKLSDKATTSHNPFWAWKSPKARAKPDSWEFPPPPTECCNKPFRRLSHHYLNLNSATTVLDLDPTRTPDKPLDKHGITSIKD